MREEKKKRDIEKGRGREELFEDQHGSVRLSIFIGAVPVKRLFPIPARKQVRDASASWFGKRSIWG